MKNNKTMIKTLVAAFALVPFLALAAPKVTMNVKAEIDVAVKEGDKTEIKRLPATEVVSGNEVFYTITYKNEGDALAGNVEVKNRIPDNTSYVLESAWGEGADIQFSIDDGKTFKKPSLLYYEVKGEKGKIEQKMVSPEKYTDVMWVIKEIPAGKAGSVGFRVRVD